jgi:hypothetical protein
LGYDEKVYRSYDEIKVDMGCFIVTPQGVAFDIESRIAGNAYYSNFRANNYITFASTDSRGLHINTRTSSNLQKVFINSTLKGTDTVTATNNINQNISIAARYNGNNSVYEYRSSKEIAFSYAVLVSIKPNLPRHPKFTFFGIGDIKKYLIFKYNLIRF